MFQLLKPASTHPAPVLWPLLDSSYKWNLTVRDLWVWLFSFTMFFCFFLKTGSHTAHADLSPYGLQTLGVWPGLALNFGLRACASMPGSSWVFLKFTHSKYFSSLYCWLILHTVLLYLFPVNGYLCCFCFWPIVSNCVCVCMFMSVCDCVFEHVYLRVCEWMRVCMNVCECIYECVSVYEFVCMCLGVLVTVLIPFTVCHCMYL